jgi:2,3-bisphosphoglycerate-independent phosphoglycerate mutase
MIYDHSINPLDDPKLDGSPCPSHTRNPVPLIFISAQPSPFKNPSHENAAGGLKDIAPTVLSLLQIPIPKEMTGSSLV